MSINNLNTYLNVRDAHLRVVSGNVYAQAMNIGGINVETAHGLQSVSDTGNVTSNTLQFSNATTGFITTANAQIGRDLVVTGNATVSTDLTVSANATVTDTLTISEHLIASKEATITGNLHVTTIRSDSNVVAEYTGPHDRPLRKYPEVALTQNDESATSGYVASRSSMNGSFDAWKTFSAYTSDQNRWQSTPNTYDSNGNWVSGVGATGVQFTDTNGGQHSGEWIKMQLPKSIKLDYIRYLCNYSTFMTKDFVILGSNDDTSWTLLKSVTGGTSIEDVYHTLHINADGYYKYYVWLTTAINGNSGEVLFNDICFYGYEEGSGSLDTTLKTVYNVPATTGTQLEVYYDGRETSSYPESGGTTVYDISPNTNNGTLNGGVGFDSTYKAFTFDGVDDYIEGDLNGITNGQWAHTMSFWFKLSAKSQSTFTYIAQIGKRGTNGQGTLVATRNNLFSFGVWGDSRIETNIEPILGEWYHISAVYSGGVFYDNATLYINGTGYDKNNGSTGSIRDEGDPLTFLTTGNKITLGKQMDVSSDYVNGSIANFRLYSKALNAGQVQELYDYQKDYFFGSKSQLTIYKGHLGVGVTEPSGQLELAGDERIQEYPPRAITVLNYHTHIEGHGEFEFSASPSNYFGDTSWDFTKAFENTERGIHGWHGNSTNIAAPGAYQAVLQYAPAVTSGDGLVESILKDGSAVLGEWIQMHSPYAINVTRLATVPRTNYGNSRGIGKFAILGSNNGIDWEYAGNGAIAPYNPSSSTDAGGYGTRTSETIAHVSTNSNGHYYTYHRLVVTHIMGHRGASGHPNYSSGASESVNQSYIRFYGTPGPTTLDKGSLSLSRSLDVPRVSRYDVDTETPRPEKLILDLDTTVNSSPTDISGQGNHGILEGAAKISEAHKAFTGAVPESGFNGISNYIRGNLNGVSGAYAHTQSYWINGADTTPRCAFTVGKNTGNYSYLNIWFKTDKWVLNADGAADGEWAETIYDNRWYHVVLTYDGGSSTSSYKLYINGEYKTPTTAISITTSLALPSNPEYRIGRNDEVQWYNGMVSNPKVYSVVLEPSEVRKLYKLGRTGRSMVISDTAVGIGKAPEAQLDVRGNIKCDVIMPRTIAFSAYRTSPLGSGNQSTTGVYAANTTYYNYGGCYDTSTYRFTAPVNGVYHFNWFAFTNQSATSTSRIFLRKNGDIAHQKGNSIERHGNSLSADIYCDAGDYVTIEGSGAYPLYFHGSSNHNHYSGHLVYATQ